MKPEYKYLMRTTTSGLCPEVVDRPERGGIMFRRGVFVLLIILTAGALCFGQAGALRDYVGLLSIHYHPDVVAYMGKFKEAFEKRGYSDAAKAIDNYLKGLSGSGFVYVAEDGACYIITNEHVVAQSESLSITFEKQDGAKTLYDNLKVLAVDEEKDLALLYFDTGVKPFTQGLSFIDRAIDEGEDVFAAGFPGLGNTAVWQFSRGTISNVSARVPKNAVSDETIGPYIQHTAQIDPGNSGGPLLEAVEGVPTGYAVIGINTLSFFTRQAANYAISVDQVKTFIGAALSKEPVNDRELIEKKVDDFIKGLRSNSAVYSHIAQYLTGACTASNAEYAILELLEKAPRTVLEDIDRTFSHDPVEGMNVAVAWLIENSMRTRSGALKISLDSIEPNYKGGFLVTFSVNDKPVKSEWVKEYGVYRLDTYGDIVTGDKALVSEKERERKLRTTFSIMLGAGYAYVFDTGSAVNAFIKSGSSYVNYGINFYYGQKSYLQLEGTLGFYYPIRLGSVALIPFVDGGIGFIKMDKDESAKDPYDTSLDLGLEFDISVQGGLMFTMAAVPGLYAQVYYHYNFIMGDRQNNSLAGVSLGYGF
jgi:serine protease Do